jgi:hypothetical protein
MILEPVVCLGSLILFSFIIEYLTRDKNTPGHPIVTEPNNMLKEEE